MNLIITDVCNRNCPYCFAESKLKRETGKEKYISMENFQAYLDFLEKSGEKKLKILGGEPTLHPQFTLMVDTSLERGFEITIFTNGLWKPEVLDYFKKGIPPNIEFVFNLNEPHRQAESENARQAKSLECAGSHGKCGYNIYRKDFNLLFLGDIIETYSLKKFIRLGLACPIVNTHNEHIADDDLKAAGTRLARQLRQLEKRDILGSFDCGFPLCIFSEAELGGLTLSTTGIKSICGPIIDVGADLTAWPCFPLGNMLNVKLTDFQSRDHLETFYREKLRPFSQFGSRDDCLGCKYRLRNQCSGGCLARGIVQWAKSDASVFEKLQLTQE
jgi:MoaA/NifB/PqqE/SkfB family radical SAM enzyme